MNVKTKRLLGVLLALLMVAALALPALASSTEITRQKAVSIGQKQVPGGILTSLEHDNDDGISSYDMEWLGSDDYEYEIEIDANSGDVIKAKRSDYKQNADSYRGTKITHEKAISIAAGSKKDLRFEEVTLNVTTLGVYYKVKHYSAQGNKLEAVLNAADGAVVSSTGSYLGEAKKGNGITLKQAQTVALGAVGGGSVVKAEQDFEDDRMVYEFKIIYKGWKYEVEVDAISSEVVKFKKDDRVDYYG